MFNKDLFINLLKLIVSILLLWIAARLVDFNLLSGIILNSNPSFIAFAIALAAGWNAADCVEAVKAFTGLPHRCQWVAERHGVRFFNDSKGTNIGATVAAIEGLGNGRNVILIAGGDSKGADFSQLGPVVQQHVRHLVLIGRDAEKIAHACEGVQQIRADSMADAVQKSQKIAAQGDVVLL